MNYVELHIGDYDKATAHLTACEDGMYGRMLRRYYDTEMPLPADLKVLQRLMRARTREEKTAVATVATEFFYIEAGEFHHTRCDEEIAKFQEAAPEREAKKENQRERQKRARARRAELFDALRLLEVVPPYDTTTAELERLLSRVTSQPVTRDDTANQSPDTRHQSITPERFLHTVESAAPLDAVGAFEGHVGNPASAPNPAAPLAIALRAAGVQVTPLNPDLIEAQREGVTAEALVELTKLDDFKGKPASYVIRAARRMHAEGAKAVTTSTGESHAQPHPRRESLVQRAARRAVEEERARQTIGQDDDGSLVPDDGDVWPSLEHDVR